MTRWLLDVNVLIALIDPAHTQHDRAHQWFGEMGYKAFATCPITENGVIRIVGHPKYPNTPGPPSSVLHSLMAIRALPGHEFWPDDVSVADSRQVAAAQLTSHSLVTDIYLLALATAHGGQLATMDHKLQAQTQSVAGGTKALLLI